MYCSLKVAQDTDDEFNLSIVQSNKNKNEKMSILLSWNQSCINEENSIKNSFE